MHPGKQSISAHLCGSVLSPNSVSSYHRLHDLVSFVFRYSRLTTIHT